MEEIREKLRSAWDAVVAAEKERNDLYEMIYDLEHPLEDHIIEVINRYLDVTSCGGLVYTTFDDITADEIMSLISDQDI